MKTGATGRGGVVVIDETGTEGTFGEEGHRGSREPGKQSGGHRVFREPGGQMIGLVVGCGVVGGEEGQRGSLGSLKQFGGHRGS